MAIWRRTITNGHGLGRFGIHVFRHGYPDYLLQFRGGIGDDLLCTIVARELQQRRQCRIAMMTSHPLLFRHNPDITATMIHSSAVHVMRRLGVNVPDVHYCSYDAKSDTDRFVGSHIIDVMCRNAGLQGDINRRPYIYLTDKERLAGKIASEQIVLQAGGMSALFPMKNKEWIAKRYQEVASQLSRKFRVIQVGSKGDMAIKSAYDLRGKLNVRDTAAILSSSRFFLGPVGFCMHLARAADIRAVIMFGGRERSSQSGYSCNENIERHPVCSPCWKRNHCDHDRICMEHITVSDVISSVDRVLSRSPDLEIDQALI
jgi:hypothetical protein